MKHITVLTLSLLLSTVAHANVQTLLQLVDYVGVDYSGAVTGGQIINPSEYAEMQEFSERIQDEIAQLPATDASSELNTLGQQLASSVQALAQPEAVAQLTQAIRAALLSHYDIVLTPKGVPDLGHAARLYAENCASCHGENGRGDGIAAATLDPTPTDFHDRERARQRSLFGLYNTITLGVEGTSMPPRPDLSDMDRWALAFYVGGFYANADDMEGAAQAWQQHAPSLEDAVTLAPAELEAAYPQGEILSAWLRHNPGRLFSDKADPLQASRDYLAQSLQAYRAGDAGAAQEAAVTGYLEGFELIEAPLSNVDDALMKRTEAAMMDFRNAIARGVSPEELQKQYEATMALLEDSSAALSGQALSPSVAFTGSLIILLREGLEIILVLAAIITYLAKSGRNDALRYVHAGWTAALAAGVGTWAVSSYLFTISGATRELTEGVTALVAAVILLYVGFWMHRNANAQRWNAFLKSQLQVALDERTLWTLALVSFLAVYREIFEIILFYEALWAQVANNSHTAVFAGAGAAFAALMLISWLIYRFGMRLPLKLFFTSSAIVMIILAFIFTGKGIAALREAGTITPAQIPFPTIEFLGIYPNALALVLQAVIVVLGIVIFFYDRKPKH